MKKSKSNTMLLVKELIEFFPLFKRAVGRPMRGGDGERSLTPVQFIAMMTIGKNDGIPMSSVADGVGICNQQATRLVDSLEQKGLVVRSQDPESRRRVLVRLTENGKAFFDKNISEFNFRAEYTFSLLDEGETEECINSVRILGGAICKIKERMKQDEKKPKR